MEVYFKELISKDATLEKLVDDLARVVQGADDFAEAIGVNPTEHPRHEIARRVHRLKESCQRINFEVASRARATDRRIRKHPYIFVGAAVLLGTVVGVILGLGRDS